MNQQKVLLKIEARTDHPRPSRSIWLCAPVPLITTTGVLLNRTMLAVNSENGARRSVRNANTDHTQFAIAVLIAPSNPRAYLGRHCETKLILRKGLCDAFAVDSETWVGERVEI